MANIFETGLIRNGDLSYNIQMRRALDGTVQQRHIWHRSITGEHNPPRTEEWINSYTRNWDAATQGMKPAEVQPC